MGAQPWETRHDPCGHVEQPRVDRADVGIEVVAVRLEPAGQVHLPDPLQRQRGDEVVDGLAPVSFVGPDVVQVEQDAAVGAVGDGGDVLAIAEITIDRLQVVGRGFDEERPVIVPSVCR